MFEIYSKEGCPYCVKIKQVMDIKKLPHKIYTLNEDFDKESFYLKFGENSTFPQVVYDNNNLGGCVDTVKYLKENNMI